MNINLTKRRKLYLVLSKSAKGYWWHIKSRNGEVIMQNEHHKTKQSLMKKAALIQDMIDEAKYELIIKDNTGK
jgi:uncharacterized protein YegP (UPF0339 family)